MSDTSTTRRFHPDHQVNLTPRINKYQSEINQILSSDRSVINQSLHQWSGQLYGNNN